MYRHGNRDSANWSEKRKNQKGGINTYRKEHRERKRER